MTDLWSLPATQLVDLIQKRETSAREVTESAIARLEAVNPAINAVVHEMGDEAIAAADAVDARIARNEDAGVLAGVPVTVKVNVDQKGYANTNGLKTQRDNIATVDNSVVSNLRKAGAIIIGRTNTPAFSVRWFTRNTVHGHTRNPRNRAQTPGGSSGGAAAAVASGIGAIAHGSDIAGSIRYPAYACGVHGLRPSLGRVASVNPGGIDRHIGAQLTAVSGPLARTVDDLRLALEAMSARDVRDPWWTNAPLTGAPYPKTAALCVAPEGLNVCPEVEAALRDGADRLRNAGWEVTETPCPPLREAAHLQILFWMSEARRNGQALIDAENDPDASFVFGQFSERYPAPDMNAFMDLLQRRAGLVREWEQFLEQYSVVLLPVSAELPFEDNLDVRSPDDFAAVVEAQLTQIAIPFMGMPGLAVSTTVTESNTTGVQLLAARHREDIALAAGIDVERGGVPPSPVTP